MTTTAAPERATNNALAKTRRELDKEIKRANDLARKLRAAQRAADKAEELEAAIRRHHTEVTVKENWGADDELWSTLRLKLPA